MPTYKVSVTLRGEDFEYQGVIEAETEEEAREQGISEAINAAADDPPDYDTVTCDTVEELADEDEEKEEV
jgi:hypothetical protein